MTSPENKFVHLKEKQDDDAYLHMAFLIKAIDEDWVLDESGKSKGNADAQLIMSLAEKPASSPAFTLHLYTILLIVYALINVVLLKTFSDIHLGNSISDKI